MAVFDERAIGDNKQFTQRAIAVSAVVLLLIIMDMVGDYRDGVPWRHLLLEMLILLCALGAVVYFSRLYYQLAQSKIHFLEQNLEQVTRQAQQWRESNYELIAGLAIQIQKQFDNWQLTPAEAEVALLMLKGLSHIEIARLRHASERTIRDQARAVYRKSGVAGRSELSAFFLEDLLLPRL